MELREAYIVDAVRTPRGKGRASGSLHATHPQMLVAQCLQALESRTGINPAEVDDVIMGNSSGTGDHGADIARQSVLAAGWPLEAPGLTINRFCGSGMQSVMLAAMGIRSGFQDCVVAGGIESMSRTSSDGWMTLDGKNPLLRERYEIVPQGISADLIATLEGFSQEELDRLALASQDRAAIAIEEGRFDRSMITITNPDGSIALDHEEHPRPGTTLESLSGLAPVFVEMGSTVYPDYPKSFDQMCLDAYPAVSEINHVHHAGNSSGVVDGASALLVTSAEYAKANGLTPRARVVMSAVAGTEPIIMLTAPTPASKLVLEKAGMKVSDIDLWEINEAFAAVMAKTMRDLDLDHDKVNVNGGAMALGHPIGATGGILTATVLDELERTDQSTALITMCTGGGMGTAMIIERV